MTPPNGPDPSDLVDLAREVAAEAAALVRAALDAPRVAEAKSTPTDPVTEVDHRTERLIVERLRSARPDDGVLGEEGGERPGTSGVRWVIDPIDGTTNFVYGFGAFAVSVAAEVSGTAVAGVVHDVPRDECFSAVRGGGARGPDGRPLAVRASEGLDRALVGTGFSYDADRRRRQAAVLTEVLPRVRDVRRAGAAALDLCWVGAGRLDAFYERGLAPWDLAAGALIAEEAGARVGALDGGPPTDFVLAASPAVHEDLADLLRRAGADRV